MHVLITTDDIPAADRFARFRDALSHEPSPADAHCEMPTDFSGRIVGADLGTARLMLLFSQTPGHSELRRGPELIRWSDPQAYRLVLNQRGVTELVHNQHRTVLLPGEFALIDTSRPYNVRRGPGAGRWVIVRFPRELLPLPANTVHKIVGGRLCGRTGIGELLSAILTQATQGLGHYRPTDAIRVSTILLDLLGGLLAHELEAGKVLPPESYRRVLFEQIQSFIQRHLGNADLSPEMIATAHHISIRTLHRLFQPHNTTVAAWIRTRRLERCRHDLAEPLLRDRPIHAVASRWGFTSPAHFTRIFRAAYGITPYDYQQLNRSGGDAPLGEKHVPKRRSSQARLGSVASATSQQVDLEAEQCREVSRHA